MVQFNSPVEVFQALAAGTDQDKADAATFLGQFMPDELAGNAGSTDGKDDQ